MIIFKNKGVIDPRAIKTFGVNVKEDSASAIGYFGTGLKYAIAVLLRHGCTISIHSGGDNYTFDLGETTIRGKNFKIVRMNEEELGFTTELGKKWEMWMAYRELYSNALDEGGHAEQTDDLTALMVGPNDTAVMVEGAEFEEVHTLRDMYFVDHDRRQQVLANGQCQAFKKMYNNMDEGILFYKGVRVGLTSGPAQFDYNFTGGIDLTEDRTMRWPFQARYYITGLFLSMEQNKDLLSEFIMLDNGMASNFEQRTDYTSTWYGPPEPSKFWLDTVGELRKKNADTGMNPTAIVLHKKFREKTVLPTVSVPLNEIEATQLEKAKTFCKETLQMDLDKFPCIVAEHLGNNGLGLADMDNNIMYIAKKCFQKGTKQVAAAIVEEYTHLDTRCRDESFEQKWAYLDTILTLGERIQGEPL